MRLFANITLLTFALLLTLSGSLKAEDADNVRQKINEGAGLISSDVDGALPRGLWRHQSRAETTGLIKNIPTIAPLSSIQKIKRHMLISTYDTSEIDEDIQLPIGDDLLTIRLLKLLEIGLWQDAFKLYSKTIKDPGGNDALAQIGLLLILKEKGLATACLDEKAFGPRFNTAFWQQFGLVCNLELYDDKNPNFQFQDSDVLQNIYADDTYKISANDIEFLNKLSLLELAILDYKNRITYADLVVTDKMPPHLVKLFIDDEQIPTETKEKLEPLAIFYQFDGFRQNPQKTKISSENIQIETQKQLISALAQHVENNQKIPLNILEKLVDFRPENKENFFYLQLLKKLDLVQDTSPLPVPSDDSYIQSFPPIYEKEVKILKTWLDNQPEFSNNPVKVYEKQISLTSDGEYTIPSGDWTMWLGEAASHQYAGISLLLVLSNNNNVGTRSEYLLHDLDKVGLIEQTHLLASDLTARLMRKNKF